MGWVDYVHYMHAYTDMHSGQDLYSQLCKTSGVHIDSDVLYIDSEPRMKIYVCVCCLQAAWRNVLTPSGWRTQRRTGVATASCSSQPTSASTAVSAGSSSSMKPCTRNQMTALHSPSSSKTAAWLSASRYAAQPL